MLWNLESQFTQIKPLHPGTTPFPNVNKFCFVGEQVCHAELSAGLSHNRHLVEGFFIQTSTEYSLFCTKTWRFARNLQKNHWYKSSTLWEWVRWFCQSVIVQQEENEHVKVGKTQSVTYVFPHFSTILCSHPLILPACPAASSTIIFLLFTTHSLMAPSAAKTPSLCSWTSKIYENEKV